MSNPSSLLVGGKLLAVVVLVLANGFFVAAEFALVAVRRSRVEQLVAEGRPSARALQRAIENLDSYLAATQLGITMSSLGLGWLGEPAIAEIVEPAFHMLPEGFAQVGSHSLAVVIAFTIITALHIVLGELAPKSFALQRPEATALVLIRLLDIFFIIFRPAIHCLNNLGNFVLVVLGLNAGGGEGAIHSPDELRLLVAASREAGLVGELEEEVVERVFRLGEQRVSAFMTPRIDIVWLDVEEPPHAIQQKIIDSIHARFLVCQGSIDTLLGTVGAKEYLGATLSGSLADLMTLVKPPLYIPDSALTLNALELFKESGSYIGVVVNEYGVIQGLLTLNDILEAIVGDIRTGNEPIEPQAVHCEDDSWLIDGGLSIKEFKELLNIRKLPEGEDASYQTVGGFAMRQLGRIPSVAENFEWQNFNFRVVAMDGHRVDKLLAVPNQPTQDRESNNA